MLFALSQDWSSTYYNSNYMNIISLYLYNLFYHNDWVHDSWTIDASSESFWTNLFIIYSTNFKFNKSTHFKLKIKENRPKRLSLLQKLVNCINLKFILFQVRVYLKEIETFQKMIQMRKEISWRSISIQIVI